MPVDIPNRANQIFQSLSEGFVHSPLQIILFFAIVLALIIVVSALAISLGMAARRRVAERAHKVFERKRARLVLTPEEAALLLRLVSYRRRTELEYVPLQIRAVFDASAERMRRSEPVADAVLNSLRLKIGFRPRRPDEAPASTSELPEGATLVLAVGPSVKLRGRIGAQGPRGMVVRLDSSEAPVAPRSTVLVQFHNRAGMFSFRSRVVEAGPGMVHLQHSSRITRHQRRAYYRREERFPVTVIRFGPGEPPLKTRILDLGGGGASMENPGGSVSKGNLLRVFFSPWIGKLAVNAQVVRLSRSGTVIHVRFESISEADRRRIMRFLFLQASQGAAKDRTA
ncbi:MAG TPA: PilZ domain-containing protein [bacterium]|nr:PilZ domain-containing protein [bacterium]